MNLSERQIKKYLKEKFKGIVRNLKITEIGSGVVGTGYLLEFNCNKKNHRLILKSIFAKNLNLDYPADRAQSFLLAHDAYNSMSNHIKSKDVISLTNKNHLKSIGDSKEFYILMEEAKGKDFSKDFEEIKIKGILTKEHKKKILILSDFLVELHKQKSNLFSCYRRKIRDTFAGDGSIMQILDAWPKNDFELFKEDWEEIIKNSLKIWMISRSMSHRNVEIHGDFHPGNLWFDNFNLTILDRARGKYGEAADDISSFLINPIFYSVSKSKRFKGAFKEMFDLFWNNYFSKTGDKEMRKIMGLFIAFRVAVVCNPIFYSDDFFGGPQNAHNTRKKMINLCKNILKDSEFNPAKINFYLSS